MLGIILAAGFARRLQPLTNETPKCLLPVAGKPILSYILNNLEGNIDQLIIVTGFQSQKIEHYVKNNYPQFNTIFIHNKDYSTTNNAYSLLLTQEHINQDFILLDSDIIFAPQIIPLLTKGQYPGITLAVKQHELSEEEIKVRMNADKKITAIGKWVPIEQSYGESIGIEYFPQSYVTALYKTLKKRVINEKNINEFYEASFQEMIEVQKINFFGIDIKDLEAIEIDYARDLETAGVIIHDKKIFNRI